MKIGILAVQGAFAEHKSKLEKLGARCVELRKKEDLDGGFAGLVLPGADHLSNDGHVYFGTMPVTVKRNAYGRQLGSFHTIREMKGIGQVPMTFIRAPYIEKCGEGAEVLAEVDGNIVAVKYKEQYGLAFHPELDEDDRIHEAFLNSVKKYAKKNSPNTWL